MILGQTMFYQQDIYIPFHLVDAAGILFFGHVFTLSHQIFEKFIVEQLEISWDDWFKNSEWIVPIKSTEANYHRPIMAGLSCMVQFQIKNIRQSSFELEFQFHQNSVNCCTVKTVHVFCSREKANKIAIPNAIRSHLDNSRLSRSLTEN
jgi:acyl-CoA thioester hydrolase/1,4-dihydroxy-2-naphthoyl-CoA hydrolase